MREVVRDQYALLPGRHDTQRHSSDLDSFDSDVESAQSMSHAFATHSSRRWGRLSALLCVVLVGGFVLYSSRGKGKADVTSTQPEDMGHFSVMGSAMDKNAHMGPALSMAVQEDLGLPAETCRREFPLFYPQLRDNEVAWRGNGSTSTVGIQESHIKAAWEACEGGCAHVVIANGGQIFLRAVVHDWQSRVRAVLQLLQKSLEAAPYAERQALDGTEFIFSNADKDGYVNQGGQGAGWVLDKRVTDKSGQYLIPDFSFSAWPEAGTTTYGEFRRDAQRVNREVPWQSKQDKIFFRGDPTIKGRRASLLAQLRKPDADSWADVKRTSFWETGPGISPIVSPSDHCRHKFLLHTEGNAYSGRSKFVLGCASAVILHDLEWTQHFHPALITDEASPDRNVVLPPGHLFDNLETLAKSLQAEEAEAAQRPPATHWADLTRAQKVALNANRTLSNRYLSPAATACYFRAALQSYSSVLDRKSWQGGQDPQLRLGGGVKPGAGAGKFKGEGLKALHLEEQGDVHLDTWTLLGQPEWPPK